MVISFLCFGFLKCFILILIILIFWFSDLLVFARLIESLDQHNIRGLPSMKITLIYSRQDIPTTKWETLEVSKKSYNFLMIPNLQIFPLSFVFWNPCSCALISQRLLNKKMEIYLESFWVRGVGFFWQTSPIYEAFE